MPKTPTDYSKTIIYKICCKDPSIIDIYVGHTTNMTKRRSCHKCRCTDETSNYYNLYVYDFIRNNGSWNNWEIIQIEEYNCKNKEEALKQERFWLDELNASLNKVLPTRTPKEYRNENKEYCYNQIKEWRNNNQEHFKHQQKEYYESIKEKRNEEISCECGCQISKINLKRHQTMKIHLKTMEKIKNICHI